MASIAQSGCLVYCLKRFFRFSCAALFLAGVALSATPAFAGSLSGKVIVVDPGHGGRDPGATANGLREKDITLAIALDLRQVLQAQGAQVVMTRTTDTDLGSTTDADLQARVMTAQNAHANAFISVHANFTADPGFSGATTFYGPASGYCNGSTQSTTDVGRAYSLAKRVQSSVVGRTSEVDRGTIAQVFWVLGDPGIPSILLETGFVSNQAEASKLANPGYQQTIASAVGDGFAGFFSSGDASGSPVAPASNVSGCDGTAASAPAAANSERWLQTVLPAPLMSGPGGAAQTFTTLPPFTYLKVLSQQGNFFYVLNPQTNGPGFVDAKNVGPSGPPPSFTPFWVENFTPTTVWSGPGSGAIAFSTLPAWHYFQVVAAPIGPRFLVKVDTTGNVAYVDQSSVGPSGPPPVAGASAPASQATPASSQSAAPRQTTVNPGDTLYAVSQRTGVSVADLIAVNHLNADGNIQAGQTLVLAGPATSGTQAASAAPAPKAQPRNKSVTIQAGDTLSTIAAQYGTTVSALMALNKLSDADVIVVGQTLQIPG